MITNNVEEAILLSDRIVPMTRGPRATLGPPIPVASAAAADRRAAHARPATRVRVRATVVEALTGGTSRRIGSRRRPAAAAWQCQLSLAEAEGEP